MTLSLDTFLQDLQAEAQLDSHGQFTLNMEHARDKLAAYLLKKTDELLFKLVQCGVAGGASKMDMETKNTHVRFVFHDMVLAPREMGQILNYLLNSDASHNRALTHLAAAVNTAVGTRPSAIALASWDGNRGHLVRWSSQGKETLDWTPPGGGRPQTVFQLIRTQAEWWDSIRHMFNQRDVFGMLFGWKTGWTADQEMVAERAAWCPVPIYMNGKLLPEVPLATGRDRSSQHEKVIIHNAEARLPSWLGCRGVRITQRKVQPWPEMTFPAGPSAAVITAGEEQKRIQVPSTLELVNDGITVERKSIQGVPRDKFVRIVASADGYQSALAGFELTKNEKYNQLITGLLDEAAALFPRAWPGSLPQLYFPGITRR